MLASSFVHHFYCMACFLCSRVAEPVRAVCRALAALLEPDAAAFQLLKLSKRALKVLQDPSSPLESLHPGTARLLWWWPASMRLLAHKRGSLRELSQLSGAGSCLVRSAISACLPKEEASRVCCCSQAP